MLDRFGVGLGSRPTLQRLVDEEEGSPNTGTSSSSGGSSAASSGRRSGTRSGGGGHRGTHSRSSSPNTTGTGFASPSAYSTSLRSPTHRDVSRGSRGSRFSSGPASGCCGRLQRVFCCYCVPRDRLYRVASAGGYESSPRGDLPMTLPSSPDMSDFEGTGILAKDPDIRMSHLTTATLQHLDRPTIKRAAVFMLLFFALGYLFQRPPSFVAEYLHEVRVNMTRTVAAYPDSFTSTMEYHEICDTNSEKFQFHNVETLSADGYSLTDLGSPADIFNVLVDLVKTLTAVLMMPVTVIPNADEFRMNEAHRSDLSLRRAPTNHFVTLGSLVPLPDMLWGHHDSGGLSDLSMTAEARALIDIVHRSLPDGIRAVGSEFDPLQSVNQLMMGPHQPSGVVMLPWTLQTAILFFPVQFTQLIWELIAESFWRSPHLPMVFENSSVWLLWIRLSFRYEILLPAMMRLLRVYITLDNLRSFFRGDPKQEMRALRLALGLLIVAVSIPQLSVFLPAMLMNLALSLFPTMGTCWLFTKLTSTTLWPEPHHHHFPSMLVALPIIVAMTFVVDRIMRPLTADTWVCTFAKATLLPKQPGMVTVDAPFIFFFLSLASCAVAVTVPVWMLRHLAPPNAVAHIFSPEYLYMQWLQSPLYNARALRTDEDNYKKHRDEHFLKDQSKSSCKYCAHLTQDMQHRSLQSHIPKQAVLFQGRRQPWEPACLKWFTSEAQRGGLCAAELRLAIAVMRRGKHAEAFDNTLRMAYRFAEGLQYAEVLRHMLVAPIGSTFYLEDAVEAHSISKRLLRNYAMFEKSIDSMPEPVTVRCRVDGTEQSLNRALRSFLWHQGERKPRLDRRASLLDQRCSPFKDRELAEGLQRYLKKESFFRDPVTGIFGESSLRALQAWLTHEGFAFERWLRDEDGEWGDATLISLQKFLKAQEAGNNWKAHAVDGHFDGECPKLLQIFLADQNVLAGSFSPKWGPKGQQALKHFLRKRGYLNEDCGVRLCAICQRLAKREGLASMQSMQGHRGSGYDSAEHAQGNALNFYAGDDDSEKHIPELRSGNKTPLAAVKALQAWLRDEGCIVAVPLDQNIGSMAFWDEEGITGLWDDASSGSTTIAIQLFLNSRRASLTVTASMLTADGDWSAPTQRRLCEYLASRGGSAELLCENAWESIGKPSLQIFLRDRGFYCGIVEGSFESLSVVSLRAWLAHEGFPVKDDEDPGSWTRAVTKSLQKFLNSAKAYDDIFHVPLEVDGTFGQHTQAALTCYLVRTGDLYTLEGHKRIQRPRDNRRSDYQSPESHMSDWWGYESRLALRRYLSREGFLSSEHLFRYSQQLQDLQEGSITPDPDERRVVDEAVQAWLESQNFNIEPMPVNLHQPSEDTSPWDHRTYEEYPDDFEKPTTHALQRFLNSPVAHQVGKSLLHEALCWTLALFGGVEESELPLHAKKAVQALDDDDTEFDYFEKTRQTRDARTALKMNSGKAKDAWWGTGEILRCLGDEAWLHSVGSAAAKAAFGALQLLTNSTTGTHTGNSRLSDIATQATVDAAVALLVGHCRNARAGGLEVAGEVLAEYARSIEPRVAKITVPILVNRLSESEVKWSACSVIRAFGLDLAQDSLHKLLDDLRLQEANFVMRASMGIGAAVSKHLLGPEVARTAASMLIAKAKEANKEDDWELRVASLRGLAELGPAAAPHQHDVVAMLDDEEGLVVAAAGEVLGVLQSTKHLLQQLTGTILERLKWRLTQDPNLDRDLEIGACQSIGRLGTIAAGLKDLLVERLRSKDLEVIQSAGEALARLWRASAVSEAYLQAAADQAAEILKSPSEGLQPRIAACATLGALRFVSQKHVEILRSRLQDEDEAPLVRQQARTALAQLGSQGGAWAAYTSQGATSSDRLGL